MNEWHYNRVVGSHAAKILNDRGIPAICIDRYLASSYTPAIRQLARDLREAGAVCAVELHFNSATPSARGNEWHYWHSSVRGRALAKSIDTRFNEWLPESASRGIKPVRSQKARGGTFLRLTHCPALIAEPFFGSNVQEWEFFKDNQVAYAEVVADGIADWMA